MSREPSLRSPFDRINDHALAAASRGTVSTQTLTAISIKEFYGIVDEAVGRESREVGICRVDTHKAALSPAELTG